MYAFEYKKAASLDDAQQALDVADVGPYMAGGITLVHPPKQRLVSRADAYGSGRNTELGDNSVDVDV